MNRFLLLLISALLSAVYSCGGGFNQTELYGETMGTTYSIKYHGGEVESRELHARVENYLKEFNDVFSTYLPDSEISRLNNAEDVDKVKGVEVSLEFQRILDISLEIASRSEGYFDPTVYPLVALWRINFKKENGMESLPTTEEIDNALNRIGYEKVKSSPGSVSMPPEYTLDFSAIAKGSGVDGISQILEENGIEDYLVEIGGEIRAKGVNSKEESWKVMIAAPIEFAEFTDDEADKSVSKSQPDPVILSLDDGAVATSGDYLNYFVYQGVKYSHLIDPHTGMPIRHYVTSVSVIADTCEEADAWATALIVMGEKGIAFSENQGIPAIFMVADPEDNTIQVIKNSLVDPHLN